MATNAITMGSGRPEPGLPEPQEGERSEPDGGGGRPGSERAAAGPPDSEVKPRRRRSFSAEYKARILREAEGCTEPGQVGALLRREGLYSSHLVQWRRQRAAAEEKRLAPRKRGPKGKSAETRRIEQLEREKARLEDELRKARIIIEYQKKVHALLEIPLPDGPDAGASK